MRWIYCCSGSYRWYSIYIGSSDTEALVPYRLDPENDYVYFPILILVPRRSSFFAEGPEAVLYMRHLDLRGCRVIGLELSDIKYYGKYDLDHKEVSWLFHMNAPRHHYIVKAKNFSAANSNLRLGSPGLDYCMSNT